MRKFLLLSGYTVLFCAILFLIVDLIVLPYKQGKFSKTVVMPELVGVDSAAAVSLVSSAGLQIGTIEYQYHDKFPKGHVSVQYPFAGHDIKLIRSVTLTLSQGKEYKDVPLLLGLTPLEAADTLQKLGLRLGDVTESYNPGDDQGIILSTNPHSGQRLARGSVVNVTISSNAVGNMAYVPSVINLTIEEGRRLFLLAGLHAGTVTPVADADMLPGTIMSQKIQPGAFIARGSSVDLTVSE
ncbi:MAG: PASTA domain-containing protein [Fibrobacteres bacterium]|nr:PASTA domain-containing protein [Fibrobacterota bacterium]